MKEIVLFGDSLLTGVMNGETSDILDTYILDELTEMGFPGYQLVKLGKRGETSSDGLARVSEAVDAEGDFVVISFGTNDSLKHETSLEAFGENLKEIIESFDASKSHPIDYGVYQYRGLSKRGQRTATALRAEGENGGGRIWSQRDRSVSSHDGLSKTK